MNLYDNVIPEAINDLQLFLRTIARNYPTVPYVVSDGTYGDKTREAVKETQSLIGLKKTGIVDFDTWSGIVELAGRTGYEKNAPRCARFFTAGRVYAIGDTADCIHIAQFIINCTAREFTNIQPVTINGTLDMSTSAMLTSLQQIFKIPAHGQLDQITWNHMNSLYDNLRKKKI